MIICVICVQSILKMGIYYQENFGFHYLSQHLVSQWVTPPTAEILCVKNLRAFVVCGFQTAPTIFFHIFSIYFFNYYGSYPENTNAPSFLTHNISAVGGVGSKSLNLEQVQMVNICHCDSKLGREDRSF